MPNVKQAVDGHNKTKLSQTNTSDENTCNCRNKKRCPMNGKCLVKSLVYQATVTTDDNRPSQTYVGLTENTFKTRFNNHKASFNSYQKRNSTELSKYVWDLKRENVYQNDSVDLYRIMNNACGPTDDENCCFKKKQNLK